MAMLRYVKAQEPFERVIVAPSQFTERTCDRGALIRTDPGKKPRQKHLHIVDGCAIIGMVKRDDSKEPFGGAWARKNSMEAERKTGPLFFMLRNETDHYLSRYQCVFLK